MILLPTNSHIALLVVLQQGGKHSNKKEFIMRTAVVCNSCLQPLVTYSCGMMYLMELCIKRVDQGQITVPTYA